MYLRPAAGVIRFPLQKFYFLGGRLADQGDTMLFCVHNCEVARLASAALSNGWETVRNVGGGTLTDFEMLGISERIVQNVSESFGLGERDPLALKISGVSGLLTSQVRAAQAKTRQASLSACENGRDNTDAQSSGPAVK